LCKLKSYILIFNFVYMNTPDFLKGRRKLLIDTLNELVEQGFYNDSTLATKFWTYRQRISDIRKEKKWLILRADTIEKYLKIIWV